MQKNQRWICFGKRIYQHASHNIVLVDLVYHFNFFINQQMSVPLSPNFTTVENVWPKINSLEHEELMIWFNGWKKSAVTCLGIIHFRTQKTITKPNGTSHSLGGTSGKVLKKIKPQPTRYLFGKWTSSSSERRLFSWVVQKN